MFVNGFGLHVLGFVTSIRLVVLLCHVIQQAFTNFCFSPYIVFYFIFFFHCDELNSTKEPSGKKRLSIHFHCNFNNRVLHVLLRTSGDDSHIKLHMEQNKNNNQLFMCLYIDRWSPTNIKRKTVLNSYGKLSKNDYHTKNKRTSCRTGHTIYGELSFFHIAINIGHICGALMLVEVRTCTRTRTRSLLIPFNLLQFENACFIVTSYPMVNHWFVTWKRTQSVSLALACISFGACVMSRTFIFCIEKLLHCTLQFFWFIRFGFCDQFYLPLILQSKSLKSDLVRRRTRAHLWIWLLFMSWRAPNQMEWNNEQQNNINYLSFKCCSWGLTSTPLKPSTFINID